MKIHIETEVAGDYREVFAGFTQDLFEALTPPEVPVRLLRFDGSRAGDEVHLELKIVGMRQLWISVITEDECTADECRFVDEGRQLPFFLSFWRHRHIIRRRPDGGSTIIDDIEFRCPLPGMSLVLYPVLWRQFRARRPVYRRIFGTPA